MTKIKYCSKCVMPSTRPGIEFDDNGVCTGCQSFEKQKQTDWGKRWTELEKLCNKHRKNDGSFDCIITVSGGKDSMYQVHVFKELLGMNPLLVTVTDNFTSTEAGKHNYQNMIDTFDCHGVVFHPKKETERKYVREMFEKEGKPTWYVDRLIYTYPLHIAKSMDIPLIIYGEDISWTYGGKDAIESPSAMAQVENGVASDYPEITSTDPMLRPPVGYGDLEPIYLSYFVPWNSWQNYVFAKSRGFKDLIGEWNRTNHLEWFDQIDSIAYLLHPWMKFPKFAHSVVTDYASKFVRYGMMTRDEAIKVVKQKEHVLDQKIIDDFCKFTSYTLSEFWSIINKHYNLDLFERDGYGWKRKYKVGE